MEKKKKNTNGQRFLPLAIMVAIGVCSGLLLSDSIDYIAETTDSLVGMLAGYLIFFLGLFAAIVFHTVVHEGGHLVFGLLSGYRFGSFRVFNLMWLKEDNRLRCKRLSVAGTAGQCLMIPPEPVDGKIPVFLYNMGGSIMNGLFAALFFGLSVAVKPFPVLYAVMLLFAIFGLALGLLNAIPMVTAFVANDGYNAISLGKNPEAMRALWVQLKVVEQTAKGIRLKDMPREWFAVPSDEAMKSGMVTTLGVFACNRLMDENRLEEARTLTERLLTAEICLSGLHRNLLINDLIYLEAVGQNRSEVIKPLLTKEFLTFQKKMSTYPSILRTQYAGALLVDPDPQKAQEIRKQFDKMVKRYPYPCELEQEYEFLQLAASKTQLPLN